LSGCGRGQRAARTAEPPTATGWRAYRTAVAQAANEKGGPAVETKLRRDAADSESFVREPVIKSELQLDATVRTMASSCGRDDGQKKIPTADMGKSGWATKQAQRTSQRRNLLKCQWQKSRFPRKKKRNIETQFRISNFIRHRLRLASVAKKYGARGGRNTAQLTRPSAPPPYSQAAGKPRPNCARVSLL
jgi:hypothetical protein